LWLYIGTGAKASDDIVFVGGFDPPCTWPGSCEGGSYCAANGCASGECKGIPAST